jgi:pyrimidine operon attenuation protein / uracil phosphoribosyltransferase
MSAIQHILDHKSIQVIIQRLTYQIAEDHIGISELGLVGLNERGSYIAHLLIGELKNVISSLKTTFVRLDTEGEQLKFHDELNKDVQHLVIVDDVLNSGRTAFLAAAHCYHNGLKSMEMVFLAVREHRSFPVYARYTGRSIATTLQEHVYFDNSNDEKLSIYLK